MNVSLKRILSMLVVGILSAVILSETYFWIDTFVVRPWVAAALVNSVIAVVLIVGHRQLFLDGPLLTSQFKKAWWWAYLPAGVILTGSAFLAIVSRFLLPGPSINNGASLWPSTIGWVLWVPLAEELVFRVGFGGLFRRLGGIFWGTYFSIALFSFMHTLPTLERVMAGEIGFTLGTLLLGAACELVWLLTKRVGAIIWLHAACNFTVVVFSTIDPRWLSWLGPIYL